MASVFFTETHLKSDPIADGMEERRIKVLAALMLLIGLIILSYLVWARSSDGSRVQVSAGSSYIDSGGRQSDAKGASEEDGSRVTVTGTVAQVIDRGKVSFLKMSPAAKYQLVSFDKIEAKEKDKVKVTGKVQTYKGKKEIVIDKITKVD